MFHLVTDDGRSRLRRWLRWLVAVLVAILAVDVAYLTAHRVVPGPFPRSTVDARGT
jgi:hypothetical protein